MAESTSSKRLTLRAVLRDVNPMVIRTVEISDHLRLAEFHDIFRTILGWHGDLGYIIRIHGQDFNSFRRNTRSKALHEFQLHRQEKFLYICDTLHLWQWDVRVLDIQDGVEGEYTAICSSGRGAPPPYNCGGPTGYRLMLKRQRNEAAPCDPAQSKLIRRSASHGSTTFSRRITPRLSINVRADLCGESRTSTISATFSNVPQLWRSKRFTKPMNPPVGLPLAH